MRRAEARFNASISKQQLHQMLVHRIAGRLHHEDIGPAHVLLDLHIRLAVGELVDARLPQGQTEKLANILGQRVVGSAGKNLPLVVLPRPYRLGSGLRVGFLVRRLLRHRGCTIARRHRRRNYAGLRCCIHCVKYPRLTWLSYTLGLETAAVRGSLFAFLLTTDN